MIRTNQYSNVNPFEEHEWDRTFEHHNQLDGFQHDWKNRIKIFKVLLEAGGVPTSRLLLQTLHINTPSAAYGPLVAYGPKSIFSMVLKTGLVSIEAAIRSVTYWGRKDLILYLIGERKY